MSAHEALDICNYLIKRPDETHAIFATGDGTRESGVRNGDLLIVDRAISAHVGDIIITEEANELTVGIYKPRRRLSLVGRDEEDTRVIEVWGVVTFVVRSLRARNRKKARHEDTPDDHQAHAASLPTATTHPARRVEAIGLHSRFARPGQMREARSQRNREPDSCAPLFLVPNIQPS